MAENESDSYTNFDIPKGSREFAVKTETPGRSEHHDIYASSYAEYDRSHYPKPFWRRRRIIFCFLIISFAIWLVTGLGIYLSNIEKDEPPKKNVETTTMVHAVENTTESTGNSTSMTSSKNKRWFVEPEIVIAVFGVFFTSIGRAFNFLPSFISGITYLPLEGTQSRMELIEITTDHNTTWNSWSSCTPIHNCLDTVSSATECPARIRTGLVTINENVIEVKEKSFDECNCEPCRFEFTDWLDGDCTRDPQVIIGPDECPCHWTEYRYCQQLSNGMFIITKNI